ncbi:40S ribosomal protein S4 [Datura stramonium]|uniref:40S ribosomal protein S4 n=1 Tax=Datura stramonium TaxID=4076 RepID=A0ABS8TC67_DATST|nr:40S ribosomal protein S4 [Datura stramonium]
MEDEEFKGWKKRSLNFVVEVAGGGVVSGWRAKVGEWARGLKKHLKRPNAPKHWMLDVWWSICKLKYAHIPRGDLTLMQRQVLVDDVVSIPKTNENFRLLYDTIKGRSHFHWSETRESKFGQKGIPYLNTYDGRTIRYPDPLIKANDTIKLDLESNKIVDFIKFDVGNVVMVTGGRNRGRVGVIKNREKHKGSFETVHIQDALGHEFATRLGNVFTLGKGTKPWVSLPKGKGIAVHRGGTEKRGKVL